MAQGWKNSEVWGVHADEGKPWQVNEVSTDPKGGVVLWSQAPLPHGNGVTRQLTAPKKLGPQKAPV
jgi:hypothetical protein